MKIHHAIASLSAFALLGTLSFAQWGGTRIRVESINNRRSYRRAPNSGVRLVRRLSDARCVQGRSWGYDSRGIWVSRGCRAEFEVRRPGRPGRPWRHGRD